MKKYLLLAALAVCLGILSTASTQAQQANNSIYACYQKNTGDLRKVSGPGQCRNSEMAISWNTAGAPGPQGPKGDKGDKGEPGVVDTSNFYTKSESDQRFIQGNGFIKAGNRILGPDGTFPVLATEGMPSITLTCHLNAQSQTLASLVSFASQSDWFTTLDVDGQVLQSDNPVISNIVVAGGIRHIVIRSSQDNGQSVVMDAVFTIYNSKCYIQSTLTVAR